MNFLNIIDTQCCTHGRTTPRHPPATTSNRPGFCRPRGRIPHVVGRNDLHGIEEAGPYSDYGTSYQRIRTVSHYDTYEKDRILNIGKYNDG